MPLVCATLKKYQPTLCSSCSLFQVGQQSGLHPHWAYSYYIEQCSPFLLPPFCPSLCLACFYLNFIVFICPQITLATWSVAGIFSFPLAPPFLLSFPLEVPVALTHVHRNRTSVWSQRRAGKFLCPKHLKLPTHVHTFLWDTDL